MKKTHVTSFTFLLFFIPLITLGQRNPASSVAGIRQDSVHINTGITRIVKKIPAFKSRTAAVQSASPGITDHNDVQILPSSSIQAELHISINKQNPNILVASANTYNSGTYSQGRYVSNNGGLNWSGLDVLNSSSPAVAGDPSTSIDGNGNIYISTITGALDGYFITKSTDGGATFSNLIRGTTTSGTFDKEMIVTDNTSGSPYFNDLYCAWTTFASSETVNFNRSIDGGNTFSPSIILKSGAGQGTNVQTGPNGEVYVCYANYTATNTFPANGFGFVKSVNGGSTFTSPQIVSYTGISKSNGANSSFNNIRVNDFPSMAVDKTGGALNGRIYVVFPALQNGNGKAVIELTYSDDQGSTWTSPKVVSISNGLQSFFPWVTVDQATGGLYIAYFSIDGSGFQTDTYLAISNDGGSTIVNQQVSDVSHITQPINNAIFNQGYEGDYIGVAANGGKAYVAWMDERTLIWQAYVSEVDNFPTPLITGTITAFCTSATFTAGNVPSGQTVTWSASPSGIVSLSPSGNQVTVTKVSEGAVTLTAAISGQGSSSINITTQPDVTSIAASMSGACSSGYQTWYLAATPNMAGATNWQWSVQQPTNGTFNIFSPNSPNTYVSVTGGGTVLVTYVDQCGETSYTEGVTIYSPCTSGAMTVFPNPANSTLTVQNNTLASTGQSAAAANVAWNNFSVELFDNKGKLLKSGQNAKGSEDILLNTSDILNGIYFLHIKQGTNLIEKEVIIQH
jgi:hypothetical protein